MAIDDGSGALSWTPDLLVGVALIDEQHRELFRRVNRLVAAGKGGRGRAQVGGTLNFLGQYVVEHFYTEEQLMLTSGYPEYAKHRKQHDGFKKELARLGDMFLSSGATTTLFTKLNRFVCEWLMDHVRSSDMAFGRFLAGRAVSG
jgi:hemerythrin